MNHPKIGDPVLVHRLQKGIMVATPATVGGISPELICVVYATHERECFPLVAWERYMKLNHKKKSHDRQNRLP